MTCSREASELRQALAEVEQLREQLAHSQRLTALGELAGTTAHEFNNILMTIINYAKLGLRHEDDATRRKAFDKILAAGNRAAKITNGVLGLARNRSSELQPIELREVVDDSLLLLERELSKYRVRIERQDTPVPPALANPTQIQQILINLLVNARQAMPQGGRIILRTGFDAQHEMVELTVRDTGNGIPAEKLPKIFEPFYSTKSGPDATGKGGTGLGLAACRDIIEAHQGKIRVESTVGKGTAVTIRLPMAQVETPAAPLQANEVTTAVSASAVPTAPGT